MTTDEPRHPLPPGFHWPDGFRAAAWFSFDFDAEAAMLADHPEVADYLDVIAHQRYGPRVAVPRLLRMLDRLGRRTTFFIPGWVAETWPDVARTVRDAGHEIGHHGYLPRIGPRRRRGDRASATSSAAWPRSTRCSVSGRSATARRRGT